MALPPPPLEDRLAASDLVVEGEAAAPTVAAEREDGLPVRADEVDQRVVFPEQVLRIVVHRVLRGQAAPEVIARKPRNASAVATGFRAIFLLRTSDDLPTLVDCLASNSGEGLRVVELLDNSS